MQLGMIGLGRMGANMAQRLIARGHSCVAYDVSADAVSALAQHGATASRSFAELAQKLTTPRVVWLMVPAGVVDATLRELTPHLAAGDIVIDGGNSYYRDDIRRARELAEHGVHYVDCGTSGGVWGRERGYCLMIGGERASVERLTPIFESLAPGPGDIERTASRVASEPSSAERGYLHCGPVGAGHFVKMVHNGIEYGLMAAYAEGLSILRHADIGKQHSGDHDAETTPLTHPEFYQYEFDLAAITELWRRGSVVSSWLLDLTANALSKDPALERFEGRVSDSGEGRWTLLAAIEEAVPAHVLSAALLERFSSRGQAGFQDKILSAMRFEFGGHVEKKA
ncbi:MAG: phosphogluconate dehydrogenase (NAD(+)-dependent, decarboxylating) [Polyangiales bacterium]